MSNNLYDKSSIESLSPLEFCRLRPQVYCGSTEYATQLLVEVVSNSIDEWRLGHGNEISVIINGSKVFVADHGQGFIPGEFREDGKTILEAAFNVINTSGKYREDGTYEGTSLGSFGIGAKLITFLSSQSQIQSWRDGKSEVIWFKDGILDKRWVRDVEPKESSGTIVEWIPDPQFFTHPEVEISKVRDLFRTTACLCPGLKIILKYNDEPKETYYSKTGLVDLIDKSVADKEIIKNRLRINEKEGKNQIDLILTYTSSYAPSIVSYVNTGLTEKGPHITQIKTILTRELNKFFREKKWLKDKEDNLSGDDIQEGAYIVFNLTAPNVAYDAQVKSTVTKIDMSAFNNIFTKRLQEWLAANEKEIKVVADKCLGARKAREAAKKAREAVRDKSSKNTSKLLNLPTKLVDAWSKKREQCELLLCEGDSAASGLVAARNGEFQAVFGLRGKIINLYKNSDERVFANQEVVNIIKALGLDFDRKTNRMIFDESKLRYGKIIMCCDGDFDGESIKNLLLTYFWSLCPELVINGYIYAAVPPLFRVTTKKNEYIYLKDGPALEEYKSKHRGEKFLINRNKG